LVARLSLARADQSDRGGAGRQSRHRGSHWPHHAGDAQAKIIGAPLLPEVDFAGFAQRVRPPGGPERNVFQAALNASYEIDFWGKNRAASRAAQETAVATRFDKEVVVLSTIAAVGNSYFLVLDGAGPAADRAAELRGRQPGAHADQAAVRCRHRLAARRRATAEPG
jgi:outer membrane protein TolC